MINKFHKHLSKLGIPFIDITAKKLPPTCEGDILIHFTNYTTDLQKELAKKEIINFNWGFKYQVKLVIERLKKNV